MSRCSGRPRALKVSQKVRTLSSAARSSFIASTRQGLLLLVPLAEVPVALPAILLLLARLSAFQGPRFAGAKVEGGVVLLATRRDISCSANYVLLHEKPRARARTRARAEHQMHMRDRVMKLDDTRHNP